jgi:hypothetical protein
VLQANTNLSPFSKDSAYQLDFNAMLQDGKIYGAYSGKGKNPGWKPAMEIKKMNIETSNYEMPTDNLNLSSINLYPNPATDKIIISFSMNKDEYSPVDIYDYKGELIYTVQRGLMNRGCHNVEVSFNEIKITSGIYFIHTKYNGNYYSIPFIKE